MFYPRSTALRVEQSLQIADRRSYGRIEGSKADSVQGASFRPCSKPEAGTRIWTELAELCSGEFSLVACKMAAPGGPPAFRGPPPGAMEGGARPPPAGMQNGGPPPNGPY